MCFCTFGVSFGDPLDPGTAAPDGPAPWMTALFDDGGSPGSVTLTLTVAGTVGSAEVTEVYLNVDDTIGGANLTITPVDENSISPGAIISKGTDAFKADADGWYDILFDLPPPGGDRLTAGETLTYSITATGLTASSFNFLSTPDLVDMNGPFFGAAKFQSTGDGEQSDWVGVVPVPAAVWLFGSGLLGMAGVARRKRS
jgi:hypothetical protein